MFIFFFLYLFRFDIFIVLYATYIFEKKKQIKYSKNCGIYLVGNIVEKRTIDIDRKW